MDIAMRFAEYKPAQCRQTKANKKRDIVVSHRFILLDNADKNTNAKGDFECISRDIHFDYL